MIDRTVTWLNLLIGALLAGAVVCVVGLLVSAAAYFGLMRPLNSGDLLPVFAAVAMFASAMRIKEQVAAEAARHGVMLEADRLALEERRARLQPVAAPLAEPAPEPDEPAVSVAQIDRLERQRLQIVAHWHVYFRRLFAAMLAYGCDRDTLTGKNRATRVTTQPGWNTATRIMEQAAILAKDNTGTRLLVSEVEWSAARMWERLPCPDSEPPEIDPPPYTTPRTTAETTINGTAKAVE